MTLQLQLFLLLFSTNLLLANSTSKTFYKALSSNSLELINAALSKLEHEKPSSTTNAYKGTLLMKKSEFMETPAMKVKVFKEGAKLLEAAIEKYPANVEYRFLRLTIQENAPKLLKYNTTIEQDKSLIIKGYKKLNSNTRTHILAYAQQSKILTVKDLE